MADPSFDSLAVELADLETPPRFSGIYWDAGGSRYRYRGSGRAVPDYALRSFARARLRLLREKIPPLVERRRRGDLSPEEFGDAIAALLGQIYREQAHLAGADILDRTLFSISAFLYDRIADLRSLLSASESGDVSPARLRQSLDRAASSSKRIFESGRRIASLDQGRVYARRFLGDTDRHCPECLLYASWGKTLASKLPLPASECRCGGNCRCRIEYYDG